MFAPFGRIKSAHVVLDAQKRSKCFGFVTFEEETSVQPAIDAMHKLVSEKTGKVQQIFRSNWRIFKSGIS